MNVNRILSFLRRVSLGSAALLAPVLVSSFSLAPLAVAQTAGTASLQGTVLDPTGASVANAKVTFANTDTGTVARDGFGWRGVVQLSERAGGRVRAEGGVGWF